MIGLHTFLHNIVEKLKKNPDVQLLKAKVLNYTPPESTVPSLEVHVTAYKIGVGQRVISATVSLKIVSGYWGDAERQTLSNAAIYELTQHPFQTADGKATVQGRLMQREWKPNTDGRTNIEQLEFLFLIVCESPS
jgi:hypothetical protein